MLDTREALGKILITWHTDEGPKTHTIPRYRESMPMPKNEI